MNVNPKLLALEKEIGIRVYEDIAQDGEERYIVFAYEDEHPVYYGNNRPIADIVYIQLSLYTPVHENYLKLKHKIRDLLEAADFCLTSISSWVDVEGTEKIRHTVFDITYTEEREE